MAYFTQHQSISPSVPQSLSWEILTSRLLDCWTKTTGGAA